MTGKCVRLARLFRADKRSVLVALDHAQFHGALPGLESMPSIIENVVAGGADGIILNPGAASACASVYAGQCALVVRVTGASTHRNPSFDYHRSVCSIERAVVLGADAVIAMGFIGGKGEAASLALLAEIAEACSRFGMPLIAEMLPVDPERFQDADWIGLAARVGHELGADIIKAYTTGTDADEKVIHGCGAPFLAAGGPKSADPTELAAHAIGHGAAGIAFGRNVFGADDPRQTVKELVQVVHGVGRKGGTAR
jgi:DhnA family fructose-bisphosphate aldolase class Ia